MNDRDKEYIKRFTNDPITSDAVYRLLRESFIKQRKTEDVYMLAAERLTLFRLEDAWSEIKRIGETVKDVEEVGNVGL